MSYSPDPNRYIFNGTFGYAKVNAILNIEEINRALCCFKYVKFRSDYDLIECANIVGRFILREMRDRKITKILEGQYYTRIHGSGVDRELLLLTDDLGQEKITRLIISRLFIPSNRSSAYVQFKPRRYYYIERHDAIAFLNDASTILRDLNL